MQLTTEQKQFLRVHQNDNVRDLALRFSGEEMPFLLVQVAGRQTAKTKIPSWYVNDEMIYPDHVSLEQASSEITAKYKASVISGGQTLVDLTGGLGVDFAFLSPHFNRAIYVEHDPELCSIALWNFAALGLRNTVIENTPGEAFLQQLPETDLVYLDPSRRDREGHKVFRIEDCSPDMLPIQDLLLEKSKSVLVKFSPMLDISSALKSLKNVCEIHVVSVENECKELLFLLSSEERQIKYYAVNLNKNKETEKFCFTREEERDARISFSSSIGKYLYEPNASILKAGAFKSVSRQLDIQKLHPNSHLYTSDRLISDFPGRVFEVKSVFAPNRKNMKTFLSETKKANISVRNFPISVAEIRRLSGLKEGGNVYLFATTLADGQKKWVTCGKV